VGHATFPRHLERLQLPLGPREQPVGGATDVGLHELCRELGLGACRLDPAEYAAHRLTAAERALFAEQGFLCIRDALPADHHAALGAALDRMVPPPPPPPFEGQPPGIHALNLCSGSRNTAYYATRGRDDQGLEWLT
jgi:hypothetical protein